MRSGRTSFTAALVLACLSVLTLLSAPQVSSDDVPIITYILNAGPEVLDVSIVGEGSQIWVDPGSMFHVKVRVRDNNTLADVRSLSVALYSPSSSPGAPSSEAHHYAFGWTRTGGFSNTGGIGDLKASECSTPANWDLGSGTWDFSVSMGKVALHSDSWRVMVTAFDEAENGTALTTFGVTKYSSIYIGTTQISFIGDPGVVVEANQNPIVLRYTANYGVDIGCWATTFTGSEIQDFTLEPSSFTIDDDRYLSEGVETGVSPVQLSDTRKALMPSLPLASDSEIQLYLFIDIPDPFYDQDYAGKVVIDMGE